MKNSWEWDWNHYELGNRRGTTLFGSERRERLLIVQDSSHGQVADIMAVTSRLNRAYAREWGHDYVRITGVLFGTKPWHSSFNKARILRTLLDAKNKTPATDIPSYDFALMLGADAVIVDLDYDLHQMLPQEHMISTNGNDLSVVFWNLNHVKIQAFSQQLIIDSESSLNDAAADGNKVLNNLLDTASGTRTSINPSLVDSFAGHVLKHARKPRSENGRKDDWLRKDSWLISGALEQIVDTVCYKFYPKCEVID